VTLVGGFPATRCGPDAEPECALFQPPIWVFVIGCLLAVVVSVLPAMAVWNRGHKARLFLTWFNGGGVLVFGLFLWPAWSIFLGWLVLWAAPSALVMAFLLHRTSREWSPAPPVTRPRRWQNRAPGQW
jgi:hypothetical protein